jgi:hypothetical protein
MPPITPIRRTSRRHALLSGPDEASSRYGYSPQTLTEPSRYRAVLTALTMVWPVLDQLTA